MKKLKNLFLFLLLLAFAFYLGKRNKPSFPRLEVKKDFVTIGTIDEDSNYTAKTDLQRSLQQPVLIEIEELPPIQTGSMQIKNAFFSILVKDVRESIQEITNTTSSLQGFVISSNVYETGDSGHLKGTISFKVPQAKFEEALSLLRSHALTVNKENVSGQDVSEEYTDLSARLRNKQATEEELLKLLKKSGSVSDILSVQRELSQVRENIEILKGRINYLEKNIAMSTITVDLSTEAGYLPISKDDWKPLSVAKSAVRILLKIIKTALNILIWLFVFLSPALLLLVLLPVFILKVLRKKRSKKKTD